MSASSAQLDAARKLLRSMGVEQYEPRVLHQLLEFMHTYCKDVFEEGMQFAEHAGRAGQLECEDVQLSVRLKASASQPHAPQLMEWMARKCNKAEIKAPAMPNITVRALPQHVPCPI
jgi:transcription initiation factor TFIID subunit 9B